MGIDVRELQSNLAAARNTLHLRMQQAAHVEHACHFIGIRGRNDTEEAVLAILEIHAGTRSEQRDHEIAVIVASPAPIDVEIPAVVHAVKHIGMTTQRTLGISVTAVEHGTAGVELIDK